MTLETPLIVTRPVMLVVGTINRYPPPAPDWTVVHVDKSDRLIWDQGERRHYPIGIQADMRDMPIDDSVIDRIQCWHALEHVNQKGGVDALHEFHRVLVPGGILDLKVPDLATIVTLLYRRSIEECMPMIYGQQWEECPDAHLNAHQWGYTWNTLGPLLDLTGFDAERKQGEIDELAVIAECRS